MVPLALVKAQTLKRRAFSRLRSAVILGRSNVRRSTGSGTLESIGRSEISAPGDGRTPVRCNDPALA